MAHDVLLTQFSCESSLGLLAPASWILARPSLPEDPARARRPAGERRRAEGNEPAPQKRRPPGNKRTTKTKIEREPRAISERRRRFFSFLMAIVRSFGSSAVMDTYPEGPEDLLLRLMVREKSVSRARWIFCARRRFRPRRSKAPSRARHLQENVAGRSRRTRTPEATSKRRRGRARAPIVRETPSLVFTIASSF